MALGAAVLIRRGDVLTGWAEVARVALGRWVAVSVTRAVHASRAVKAVGQGW